MVEIPSPQRESSNTQVRKVVRAASGALEPTRAVFFGICTACRIVDKGSVSIYRQFGSEHLSNRLDLWQWSRSFGHLDSDRIAGFPRERSLGAGSV